MHKFTNKQIENTIKMVDSLIINCEKIKPKLKEGSPQLSLNKSRIEALNISKILLMNEKNDYKKDELVKASVQIT
ncbi:MAG: hypothetical protein ACRC28_16995 [Clostridium sp.]|uniref:hypothetical protein n=1 Tax=Clostridium sp. TaxID=1506 RepID=UPI003F2AAB7A